MNLSTQNYGAELPRPLTDAQPSYPRYADPISRVKERKQWTLG